MQTIIDCVAEHTSRAPDALAFRFISDQSAPPQKVSYRELTQRAALVAAFLSGNCAPQSRVLLLMPPGISYVVSFLGCLMANMIAVPLYPSRKNVRTEVCLKVRSDCQASLALTGRSELAGLSALLNADTTASTPVHAIEDIEALALPWAAGTNPSQHDIAFLQYTSGSTGAPKGVVITHQNILGNVRHLTCMAKGSSADVFVNWLPLFHDLGLITAVMWPLYLGAPSTIMAPAAFIREPSTWLKAISRYRGTMCGAPNFAYDLCADKLGQEDLAALDLSSWRVAYNAAEPVRAETLERFAGAFKSSGFDAAAFYPGYGMAEATVFISGGDPDIAPTTISVDRQVLGEGRLRLVPPHQAQSGKLVSCGHAAAPHDVRVINAQRREADEGEVGEIWFAGPSVSPGYWGKPDLNAAVFGQRLEGGAGNAYLRTGDLGVMWGGELFVTGRIKDLVIVRGTNFYPQDIEVCTAQAHSAVRPGHVAAFTCNDAGRERLVIAAEIKRERARTLQVSEVESAVRHSIASNFGISADQVVLVQPYRIPVTSSGKIQRNRTREMLLGGTLETIAGAAAAAAKARGLPGNQVEQVLGRLWCEVLELEQIGMEDNFFEAGGDSLRGHQMAAEIAKRFVVPDFAFADLLDHPTIAAQARHLLSMQPEKRLLAPADAATRKTVRV